jgi:hypothetical protein
MTRADKMMSDWLAEVDAQMGQTSRQEDHDLARKRMQNTLAYQSAAFLDALEAAAMTLLRALRIVR